MYSLAATRAELAEALHGRIRSHHRFLIGQHLKTVEQLEETIAAFDARIEAALEPFRDAIERLKEVPGLSGTSAQILIAEIGTDMPVEGLQTYGVGEQPADLFKATPIRWVRKLRVVRCRHRMASSPTHEDL